MNDLQKKILDIYIEIKRICDDNNLRFYAIGGTCIGAVRHNGFIPWDDDLDIAMPRNDYEKFKKICIEYLPANYQLIEGNNAANSGNMFLKVHDVDTCIVHDFLKDHRNSYMGVYVDIMPLDSIPNNKIWRSIHLSLLRILIPLNSIQKKLNPNIKTQTMRKMLFPIVNLFPDSLFFKLHSKIVRKYDFDDNRLKDSAFTWSIRAKKLILNKADFSDYTVFKFENTEMRCPVGYHHYLKTHFNNYMEIPKKDKQITHNNLVVDLKNSFKKYQTGEIKID